MRQAINDKLKEGMGLMMGLQPAFDKFFQAIVKASFAKKVIGSYLVLLAQNVIVRHGQLI